MPIVRDFGHLKPNALFGTLKTFKETVTDFDFKAAVDDFDKISKNIKPSDDLDRDFLKNNGITTGQSIQNFVRSETAKEQGGGFSSLQQFYRFLRFAEQHDVADHIGNICVNSENITTSQKALFIVEMPEEVSSRKTYNENQRKNKSRILKRQALKFAQDTSVGEPDRAFVYNKISNRIGRDGVAGSTC